VIAQLPKLDTILKRHKIHPKFWPEFHGLVEEGQRPGNGLRTRLNRVTNYKAALAEVLAELSKGLEHKFPPADYQSPVSYESLRYEEIEPEDSVPVTSAGAPSAAR
jgi:hypothetical protein